MKLHLAVVTLFFSGLAAALGDYKTFDRYDWELFLPGRYFTATGVYTPNGTLSNLVSGNSYSIFQARPTLRYMLTGDFSLSGGVNYAFARSQSGTVSRTNSNITDIFFSADWLMARWVFDLILEGGFSFPLVTNSLDGDKALINEGVKEFWGGLRAQQAFDLFRFYGHLSYSWRETRAALLPYSVGLILDFASVSLGAELAGHRWMSNDRGPGNEFDRSALIANVNGGVPYYMGVNPNLMAARGFGLLDFGTETTMELGAGFTLNGSNSAAGWWLDFGLKFNIGERKRQRLRGSGISAPTNPQSVLPSDPDPRNFEEDKEDGVDQNLFRRRRANPQSPPVSPAVEDESIQQKLDETEMIIELRKNKRKRR
ncbi:MAG: hypothetical protein N2578_02575 [Bdellovibrionaceae bacterium]|nr:hypothetical protein [Pseudobdellovibrionaceae bacterium]